MIENRTGLLCLKWARWWIFENLRCWGRGIRAGSGVVCLLLFCASYGVYASSPPAAPNIEISPRIETPGVSWPALSHTHQDRHGNWYFSVVDFAGAAVHFIEPDSGVVRCRISRVDQVVPAGNNTCWLIVRQTVYGGYLRETWKRMTRLFDQVLIRQKDAAPATRQAEMLWAWRFDLATWELVSYNPVQLGVIPPRAVVYFRATPQARQALQYTMVEVDSARLEVIDFERGDAWELPETIYQSQGLDVDLQQIQWLSDTQLAMLTGGSLPIRTYNINTRQSQDLLTEVELRRLGLNLQGEPAFLGLYSTHDHILAVALQMSAERQTHVLMYHGGQWHIAGIVPTASFRLADVSIDGQYLLGWHMSPNPETQRMTPALIAYDVRSETLTTLKIPTNVFAEAPARELGPLGLFPDSAWFLDGDQVLFTFRNGAYRTTPHGQQAFRLWPIHGLSPIQER